MKFPSCLCPTNAPRPRVTLQKKGPWPDGCSRARSSRFAPCPPVSHHRPICLAHVSGHFSIIHAVNASSPCQWQLGNPSFDGQCIAPETRLIQTDPELPNHQPHRTDSADLMTILMAKFITLISKNIFLGGPLPSPVPMIAESGTEQAPAPDQTTFSVPAPALRVGMNRGPKHLEQQSQLS